MHKLRCILSITLAAALLTQAGASIADKKSDTLNIGMANELPNVDAYFDNTRVGIIVSRHIWDNLLYRDPADFSYKPALATSYKWINDTTLEFNLRKGVTFHNGEAFDADDVVHTFNFVSSPEANVMVQRNVNWIKNAEKIDQHTVRVNLKAPFPAALDFLAGSLPIYPNEYYAKVGPKGMNESPIGTGPYQVVSIEPAKKMVMKRNANYYKESPKGQPGIGNLVWHTIPDSNTRIAELMTGGVEWAWRLTRDQAEQLNGHPAMAVSGAGTMRIGYLAMDAAARGGKHPVNDVNVRRAIAHAINRQSIIDNLLQEGSGLVHSACYPSQFGCTQDVTKYDYNPEKAKAMLADAGYQDGFNVTIDAYRDRSVAEAIIGDLARVGIKADLNYNKYVPTRDHIRAGKSKINFMTWGSYSINDVSAITGHFFNGGADDNARDDEVIGLLEKGDSLVDAAARKDVYGKALNRIADQVYWLPLWNYALNYAYSNELDFTPTADEIPRFFTASWK